MDLLTLQGQIKRDPDGYADEFRQQYRHYKASLEIFKLKPTGDSREFGDLVGFISQVAACYPRWVLGFAAEVSSLLEEQAAVLDSQLRLALVRALILMRNKGALSALDILPTLFRLFRCHDKVLKQLLFRHIIADIKAANRKHKDNKLNRGVQTFLYGLLQGDDEAAALRALAVLTELHRRNVWQDARTINVIASATQHPSSRVMLASLKFFLGQDEMADVDSDDEDGGPSTRRVEAETPGGPAPATPTSKDVYSAKSKGTNSSKRKKAAKLKRVMQAVKKHERRAAGTVSEAFAAMQLLHDPQEFAERLFRRLQKGNERLETRLCMMSVISRAIGVHHLSLLNFYPFLQKYIQPHQRDVTQILAILVQAVHDQVPPQTLEPVLKQLADQFINDRSRPEAMAVGLKAIREMVARSPHIMTADLLQDLVLYRKFKNKEVSSAARALLALFRQLNPSMLAKKDRGKGADLDAKPLAFGEAEVADRIEGADLLQAAELAGSDDEDEDGNQDAESEDSEGEVSGGDALSDEASCLSGDCSDRGSGSDDEEYQQQEEEDVDGDRLHNSAGLETSHAVDTADAEMADSLTVPLLAAATADAGSAPTTAGASSEVAVPSGGYNPPSSAAAAQEDNSTPAGEPREPSGTMAPAGTNEATLEGSVQPGEGRQHKVGSGHTEDEKDGKGGESDGEGERDSGEEEELPPPPLKKQHSKKRPASSQPGSMRALKAQLMDARASKAATAEPLEWGRIMTEADFDRIKELRHKKLTDDLMARHGMRSNKALGPERLEKLREAIQGEAEEALQVQDAVKTAGDQRVRANDLASTHKGRRTKEERMASVLEGREGRMFGAAAGRKKNKTGGLSNRQQQKNKNMPAPARTQQLKRRASGKPRGAALKKAQRGHTGAAAYGRSGAGRK